MSEIEHERGLLFMGIVDFCRQCEEEDNRRRCEETSAKISNGLQI